MNIEKIREILINDKNINLMSVRENLDFNVKKILNNNYLSQSQSIRFGKIFENFLKNIIKENGYTLINEELVDIHKKGLNRNKDKKDLDICFIKDDTIFYFESKINLNLDSEKSKVTDKKISEINEYLVNENKKMNVNSSLITCWWEKEEGMSVKTNTNLLYMRDFFKLLEIENITSYDYYDMMSDFGNSI